MQADLNFEIKEGNKIRWVITIDTEAQWFFNIAARAYKAMFGHGMKEQEQIDNADTTRFEAMK